VEQLTQTRAITQRSRNRKKPDSKRMQAAKKRRASSAASTIDVPSSSRRLTGDPGRVQKEKESMRTNMNRNLGVGGQADPVAGGHNACWNSEPEKRPEETLMQSFSQWFWSKTGPALFAAFLIVCLTTVPASAQYWEFNPFYKNSAGEVSAVSIAVVSNWTVTAVCNSTGNLEVIVWSNANLSRAPGSQNGASCPSQEVAITALGGNAFVTAISTTVSGQGQLRLDSWKIGSGGAVSHGYDAAIAMYGSPSIATLSTDQVVTASIDVHDTMHVIAWYVDPSTLYIAQQSSGATASGSVGQAGIANAGQGYVATASVPPGTRPQPFTVTGWYVASNGVVTMEGRPDTIGVVSQFAVSSYSNHGLDYVATAVVNGSVNLETILWSVSSSGATRGVTGNAGQATYAAVCGPFSSQPYGGDQLTGYLFTAVSGGDSYGDVELWSMGSGSMTESYSYNGGMPKISSIAAACSSTAGNDFAVTADINSASNDLELVQWALWYNPIIP
jgi:hypothetical protein